MFDTSSTVIELLTRGLDPVLADIEGRAGQPFCQSDPTMIDDGSIVDRLVVLQAEKASRDAEELTLLAELSRRASGWRTEVRPSLEALLPLQVAADEVAAALRWAPATAAIRVDFACAVTTRLPATVAALAAGKIDTARVHAIFDLTAGLSDDHAREAERQVIERAAEQTPGQLRARLRRVVLRIDPAAARARGELARRGRRVEIGDERDGMAHLWAFLNAPDAVAAFNRLDRLARGCGADDPRTMDQRRADTLVDILLARVHHHADPAHPDPADGPGPFDGMGPYDDMEDPSGPEDPSTFDDSCAPEHPSASHNPGVPDDPRATGGACAEPDSDDPHASTGAYLELVASQATLNSDFGEPADLLGYGPISAHEAREVARRPDVRVVYRETLEADALALAEWVVPRHDPPERMAVVVRARDGTCRFPSCRAPARRCDTDHTVRYPDGPTRISNLACLCRRHHRLKHETAWLVVQLARGVLRWTSPTGRVYLTHPDGPLS